MVSDELSASLKGRISKYSTTGQTKMLELHGKFHYTEDDIETFLINNNLDSLQEKDMGRFQEHLEREAASRAAKAQKQAPQKRRTSGARVHMPDVFPSLGPQGNDAGKPQQAETPIPKKPRQGEEDAGSPSRLSPEPTPKPQVSRRTSVNEKLEKPQPGDVKVTVQLLGDSSLWTGRRDGVYEWMDESIEERSRSQDLRLAEVEGLMTTAMLERHAGEELVVGVVGVPAQAELILCGRLACEGLTGKLNERSILLEGSRDTSGGNSVRLNLGGCKSIVAVPGQIVAVVGRTGMTGTTFHARDFLPGLPIVPRALPRPPRPLHLMIAAGPFCLRDGLNYDPLKQLLEYAVHEKPQALVLMGPFLDAGNLRVTAGDTTIPEDVEPCSFEEVYTQHLLPLLSRGLRPLLAPLHGGPPTEVLIVPSLEEVLCFHPLPQPPLDVSLDLPQGSMDQLRQQQVRFLPNPAHVSIGGVNMSFTASDALSPVVRDIVLRPEGKKIEEAHRVMLGQRTLFPVVPREPAQVSEARAAALDFPGREVPDVCVFPSVTGVPTSTAVDETVFVNPGSLCRPAALGTFAEMWLVPPSAGEAAESTPFAERVRIDIQKLN